MNRFDAFACAALIKEIGRGARGARSLARDEARLLYEAILDGRVSDLELGAVLIAYRIKGESPEELAGMLEAVHAAMAPLRAPHGTTAVSIPSYNGARKQPNLVPLLALLLAREGVPVLIHGVMHDPGRVTTAEVLAEMGILPDRDRAAAEASLCERRLAMMPIDALAPALARQLSLRSVLGVRNSAHTLAKLIHPFAQPALRLVNYTHPAYRDTLAGLFSLPGQAGAPGVLLARGSEGEAAADPAVPRPIEWLRDGQRSVISGDVPRQDWPGSAGPASREAAVTAEWTRRVMQGEFPIPAAIAAQVQAVRQALG